MATKICRNPGCKKAGQPQPLSDFYINRTHSDGHMDTCKECDKQKNRARSRAKKQEFEKFFTTFM